MQHTDNYQLNQWEKTDRILMSDFNADNQKIDAALKTIPRLQIGSYTGTGVHGAANPNMLTFDFPPELLFITQASADAERSGYFIRGAARGMVNWKGSSVSNSVVELAWSGTSVSWYDESAADHQLNLSGCLYRYVAFGTQEA